MKEQIIIKARAERAKDFIAQNENNLNAAVSVLRAAGFIIDDVTSLRRVNGKWLAKEIEASRARITKTLGFVPANVAAEFAQGFARTKQECEPAAEEISGILKKYDALELQESDGKFTFTSESVDAYAAKQATYIFNADEVEYYSMIMQVKADIEKIRDFESSHSFCDFSSEIAPILAGFDEEKFLNRILQGEILRHVEG